jgi:hypothetical protein
MFTGLQGALIAAGLSGLVAFGAGWKFGSDHESAQCEKKIEIVKRTSAELIDKQIALKAKAETEAAFAKGEVAKVNAEIQRQLEEQRNLLLADQAAREDAAKKADQAAVAAERQARATAAKFQAALEALKHDPDNCARAPVSADVKRMLDDLLAGATP